jgi:hypothetical protein
METQVLANQLDLILSGKVFFTLVSAKTGQRFKYRVTSAERGGWFVSLLEGEDFWKNYRYIGFIPQATRTFHTTKGSTLPATAPPVAGFEWTFKRLIAGQPIDGVEIWHAVKSKRAAERKAAA